MENTPQFFGGGDPSRTRTCNPRSRNPLLGTGAGFAPGNDAKVRAPLKIFFSSQWSFLRKPHEATLTVLMYELAAAGIIFTEKGVEFRRWPAKPYVPTGIKRKNRSG